MIKNRKQMFALIGAFILTLLLGTVTYAFFNYTRTGSSNTIKTGRIAFNTSQSSGNSEAINLTNVFPITRSELGNDVGNSAEVEITIAGDTTYTNGLEYLVTFEDVNIETSTNKKIPIGIEVTPEKTGELGTENTNYFNEGVRGGNTSYYKVLADNVIHNGDYVLVGYIKPGEAEINGTIGIKAFIDKDKILISDTYDGSESDNMGTPRSKAQGKVVLTTSEWNGLQGNNSISFKVRIQANEGIWVGDPTSRNDMLNIYTANTFTSEEKSAITEINFIRMSEEMIDTHTDVVDLTAAGGQGVVKAWVENNKLYIASPGQTYFPVNSSGTFQGYANVTKINFNNINTSNVTGMNGLFSGCSSLISIDLSNFDMSNVTGISSMFYNCSSLTSLNLDNLGSDYLNSGLGYMFQASGLQKISMRNFNFGTANLAGMFSGVSNLIAIDLSGSNTSGVTSFGGMFVGLSQLQTLNMDGIDFGSNSMAALFNGLPNLREISLKNVNTSNVTNMAALFSQSGSIKKIDLSDFDTNKVTAMDAMFNDCTSLEKLNLSSFNTSSVTSMGAMFGGCGSLRELDLSSFNTSMVNNMSEMFAMGTWSGNNMTPLINSLTTIYVGPNWTAANVTDSSNMFYNNTHIVGGNGTIFDTNYTDKAYARIDGGVSNPGYLTLKTN